MTNAQEMDDLILSLTTARWQKTASVIARALGHLGDEASDETADAVAKRIEHLVKTSRLESQGDLSRWRRSEIWQSSIVDGPPNLNVSRG